VTQLLLRSTIHPSRGRLNFFLLLQVLTLIMVKLFPGGLVGSVTACQFPQFAPVSSSEVRFSRLYLESRYSNPRASTLRPS